MEKIRVGISACLLGDKVRYNGEHKHEPCITDTLLEWIEFVPFCPETELGLGVPRKPVQLEGDAENPRLVVIETGEDLTDAMLNWCCQQMRELEKKNLCGFIFKSRSPSCGVGSAPLFSGRDDEVPSGWIDGLFAGMVRKHFRMLPVAEEEQLRDSKVRARFLERLLCVQSRRN